MTNPPTSRTRRLTRALAVATLTATVVAGALAAPASAANSQLYDTMAQCVTAQRAYGASSFVRISRSCYGVIPKVDGVWDPNNRHYRFDYVSR